MRGWWLFKCDTLNFYCPIRRHRPTIRIIIEHTPHTKPSVSVVACVIINIMKIKFQWNKFITAVNMSSYYVSVLHHWFPSLFVLVKFLVFPSQFTESPPPCGGMKNCSVTTQLPFLPKNPMNQTGNTTAGKTYIGLGDHTWFCAIMARLTSHVPQLWVYMKEVFL